MKLSRNFIFSELDGQTVLVPVGESAFHGMVEGNKIFSAILESLREDTTEEKIVEELCGRFDGDEDCIRSDVAKALNGLRQIGAIEE